MNDNALEYEKKKQNLCHLFMLFAIYATDSMITISINQDTTYYYGFRYLSIIICIVFFLCNILQKNIDRTWILIFLSFAVSFLGTIGFNGDKSFAIPIKLVYVLLGYFAVKYFGAQKIFDSFVRIMILIVSVSLLCYVISLISLDLFEIFPDITIVAQKSKIVSYFNNVILTVVPKKIYGILPRNYGMFSEPGTFQVYLIFALLIVLYGSYKKRKLMLSLLILGILTTFSTTGYIVTCALFVFYYITQNNINSSKKIVGFLIILVVGMVLIRNETIFEIVFGKLQSEGDASTISRFYSFPVNFKIWLENPLFGVGPINMNNLATQTAYELTGSIYFHNTNTYMYTLACYGIYVFGFEIIKCFRLAQKFCKKSFLSTLGIFFIIFLALSGENLTQSVAIETLTFCGFISTNNMIKKEKT